MPSLPVVAIVGRPNVGKSTLFNRLIGRRTAIISEVAGTTRDRVYGTSEWNGRTFTVVDTGGLELEPGTSIEERVQDQARGAIDEAEAAASVSGEDLTEEELAELAETEMGAPRVAIVGRPNTGKSTFVNKVLGSDRMIVSEVPGTTRDPVDTAVELDGQPLVLVDTAGIRRRGSIDRGIERYSVLRSMKAIDSADVAVVMTDATEGYTAQDAHVVGHVLEAGKGIVLVINKWDVVEKDGHTADQWLKALRREAPYLAWADIVFASALTGQRVERILREARRVAEERYRRVPTGDLNRLVMDAVRAHPPSHVRNRLPKIYYAAQVGVAPPTFVIFVNDPELVHFSYKRYLENRVRAAYGFLGTPIRLILRERESEEAARRTARPRRR